MIRNKFEKISEKQWIADVLENTHYGDLKLPERATKNSAGYDFFAPFDFTLNAGDSIKIPTGIRVTLQSGAFLMVVPRSSLGFKYRLQLDNTVGIIDADYAQSDNEGHIWIKLTNDSTEGKTITVNKGEAFAQGIITQYLTVDNDTAIGVRNGGIGSTNVVRNPFAVLNGVMRKLQT